MKEEFENSGGSKSVKDKVCLPLLTVASPFSVQYPTKITGSMEVTLIYKNFHLGESSMDSSSRSPYGSKSVRNYGNDPPTSLHKSDAHGGRPDRTHINHYSSSCCNNINYNTIPRSSSSKDFSKSDFTSSNQVGNEQTRSSKNETKGKMRDRALSPIQELSANSNSSRDQIENLRQSLERLVEQEENNKVSAEMKTNFDSDASVDSYLEKCRNVVQVESSSDDGLDSIIPTVKPNMKKKKSKNRNETNHSLTAYQTSKNGNPRSYSLNSENLDLRVDDNFDVCDNMSEGDTLKSVSSVNSDDSSSHAGFIAFNKDFVKNECNKTKNKHSVATTTDVKTTKINSLVKDEFISKCTQTTAVHENITKTPSDIAKQSGSFFKVKIEVERAINLPLLAPYSGVNKQKPSSYVSFDAFIDGKPEHIASDVVYNSTNPVWNASWNVMLPTEYLYKVSYYFVFD